MNNLSIFVPFILLFLACNDAKRNEDLLKHTASQDGVERLQSEDQEFENPDLVQIRKEFISSYEKVVEFDTSYYNSGRKIEFRFRHYCKRDSSILIPARYNFDTNAPFRTHNFESWIQVISGSDTVLDQRVDKSYFSSYLDTSLKAYAVLFPSLSFKDSLLDISYSISIPVTDVGIGLSLIVNEKGAIQIKQ